MQSLFRHHPAECCQERGVVTSVVVAPVGLVEMHGAAPGEAFRGANEEGEGDANVATVGVSEGGTAKPLVGPLRGARGSGYTINVGSGRLSGSDDGGDLGVDWDGRNCCA